MAAEPIACEPDAGFVAWLQASGGSLLVSTYQAGRLLFLEARDGALSVLARAIPRPMGIDARGDALLIASKGRVQLYRDAPALAPLSPRGGPYDALYLPAATWLADGLDLHDVAFGAGAMFAVNTRRSCLVSCHPCGQLLNVWAPPWITGHAPEDRCHLNGLALRDGKPAAVTCLGRTDTPHGWRDGKATGGALVDVASGRTLLGGLAMPHSPRWHSGALWLLHSGQGQLLRLAGSTAETVAELPAYLRGLCFIGNAAVVGLCQIRESNSFGGMPVQARHAQLLCGLAVIDTATGRTLGLLRFTSGVHEIYDVRHLPGRHAANLLTLDPPLGQGQQELRRAA